MLAQKLDSSKTPCRPETVTGGSAPCLKLVNSFLTSTRCGICLLLSSIYFSWVFFFFSSACDVQIMARHRSMAKVKIKCTEMNQLLSKRTNTVLLLPLHICNLHSHIKNALELQKEPEACPYTV